MHMDKESAVSNKSGRPPTMDAHQWPRVKALFEEALNQPPGQHAAFLDQACGDDDDLRRQVEAMLAAHDDETPFLDDPLSMESLLVLAEDAGAARAGMRIGPYRLVGEIGRGGMGVVYLAERADGRFEQQVAVKLVGQGLHDEHLLHRFRAEQQILAALEHPNIARLYDGGLADNGAPYLVMEYVEGQPIDQYCDTHRLSTDQRLALFRAVCAVVQYAHQNLVVHRDLKPSNIMVTEPVPAQAGNGRVKLLDFGIAKLLSDDDADAAPLTRTGMRVMTPEYASPEQVRGEPVTTASDVYALGVILYQLLTGHRPYQVRGLTPSEVERVVCEQEPQAPSTAISQAAEAASANGTTQPLTPDAVSQARSTHPERLRRSLKGDLDNIVLKALRKEPARRYASVEQFAEDIRRYLERLPVTARPDTVGYRLAKFVRRHTVGVVATALVALALVGGIIATATQARIAQNRFDDVRTLANTLLFDLHDDIRDLPGATPARRTLVTHAITYLDKLHREAGGDPSLQLELAQAYDRIGRIQGNPHYTNLGDLAGAQQSYEKALTLREELWHRDTTNATARLALASSYGHLGVMKGWDDAGNEAIVLSTRALTLLAPLLDQTPENLDALHVAGRVRSELGWWMIFGGRIEDGLVHAAEAMQMLESIAPRQPENQDLQLHLWRAYSYRIDGLRFTGRHQEALDLIEAKGLPHLQATEQRWPTQPRVLYGLHIVYDYIGEMQHALGHPERAVTAYEEALRYADAMVRTDSTNHKGHEALARAYVSKGYLLAQMDRLDDAVPALTQAISIRQMLYAQNEKYGNMLGNAQRYLCRALLEGERLEAALEPCLDGVATQEKTVEGKAQNTIHLGNLGSIYTYAARVYRELAGQVISQEERRQHLQEAFAWYDKAAKTLTEVKKHYGARYESVLFEIHPDSLSAERDAFVQELGLQ